jgi:predicted nucleic acid-binding protein
MYLLDTSVVAELRRARSGRADPRPLRDGLIAATALVHAMLVVTRNGADVLPTGVELLNPWSEAPSQGC